MAQESRLVDGNTLTLDIVAIRDQRAVIIEPTNVYENTPTSLQQGNKVKIQKYRPLSDVIKDEHGDNRCTRWMVHSKHQVPHFCRTPRHRPVRTSMSLCNQGHDQHAPYVH